MGTSSEAVAQFPSEPVEGVDISDWPLHVLTVSVTAPGVPDDGVRRNLGLVGFVEEVTKPVDFHRLASRVGTWPYEAQAELVEGLSYCAFLVEGAYPMGGDFMSDCVLIVAGMESPVEFSVAQTVDSTQNPKGEERDLVPVSLRVEMTPKPKSSELGNLFLIGFEALEEHSGRPGKGQRPSDHLQVEIGVSRWPWEGDVSLREGLHYFAVWSKELDNPRTGDPLGGPIHVEVGGSQKVEIVIDREATVPRVGPGGEVRPPGSKIVHPIGTAVPGEPSPSDPCCVGGGPEVCRDARALDAVCKSLSDCCETTWGPMCSDRYRESSQLCHDPKATPSASWCSDRYNENSELCRDRGERPIR